MATWGYLRVSTNDQNTENQRLAVLDYANRNKLSIDHCQRRAENGLILVV